ncbi:MAG TPA: Gfo/Idh/MocA family oxidoreductase [Vicinamibacterales bacterium]
MQSLSHFSPAGALPLNTSATRVGIIGAGVVTSGSHLPVLVNMSDVSVEWICDRSPAAAESVARSYGIRRAFVDLEQCPDVDLVLVATPVGTRRDIVPHVLARGWHAFCEKPFALTVTDHDAFVADARARGAQIGVGQVRRYARPTASARALLSRDAFGPVRRVLAADGFRMRGTGRGGGWHLNDRAEGGVLAEFGSHLIDQVVYLLSATGASVRDCAQRVHRGLELASSVVADLSRASGPPVPCAFDVSLLDDLCSGIFIEFPSVTLRVGLGFDDTLTLVGASGETLADLTMHDGALSAVHAFFLEWRDFLRQCRTGEPSAVDAASVTTTTAIIDQAVRGPRAEESEPLVEQLL